MADGTEPNRLVRTQPTAPVLTVGGRSRVTGTVAWPATEGTGSMEEVAISLMSALHQGYASIVPVHEQADGQGDGEVDQHGQENPLDRLAGLIQGRLVDRDQV